MFRDDNKEYVAVTGNDGKLYLLDGTSLGGANHATPLYATPEVLGAQSRRARSRRGKAASHLRQLHPRRARRRRHPPRRAARAGFSRHLLRSPAHRHEGRGQRPRADGRHPRLQARRSGRQARAAAGLVLARHGRRPCHRSSSTTSFSRSRAASRARTSHVRGAACAAFPGRPCSTALDGLTGKELWNSGKHITSFARSGLAAGGSNGSQVFVTTYDSTLYAFGFPIER